MQIIHCKTINRDCWKWEAEELRIGNMVLAHTRQRITITYKKLRTRQATVCKCAKCLYLEPFLEFRNSTAAVSEIKINRCRSFTEWKRVLDAYFSTALVQRLIGIVIHRRLLKYMTALTCFYGRTLIRNILWMSILHISQISWNEFI